MRLLWSRDELLRFRCRDLIPIKPGRIAVNPISLSGSAGAGQIKHGEQLQSVTIPLNPCTSAIWLLPLGGGREGAFTPLWEAGGVHPLGEVGRGHSLAGGQGGFSSAG
ncbi:MAG: hypothetical protein WCJ26_14015 [bacterium]